MPPVKTVKNDTDVVVPKAGEMFVSEDGTVSQVLDDHIDADYEPTEEEVLQFADWIGMKLPDDSEYLWLAREGLRTPLPKEWKSCITDGGEVYYFNFKTGESSWDHPMDSLFRQRFEQEKEKAHKKGKSTPAAASGKATTSTNNLSGCGSGASITSPAGVIPQTRVIITDAGMTSRDTGLVTGSTLPTTAASGLSSGNRNAAGKSDVQTASPHPQQNTLTAGVKDPINSTSAASRVSTLGGKASSVGFGGGGGGAAQKGGPQPAPSSTSTPAPVAPLPTARRIVSEAERAMEEKVQREAQQALEAEKAKLAEAHQTTLASLQQLYENDVAEIRATDAARRIATTKQEDEERERRLQQTREKCEELYGDELRTLEHEEETLKSKLQKMEAEAARAASGNTQRTQIEEQMQNALARQRADVEATMKRQHDAAMAAEDAAHTAATQKIEREGQAKVTALQQAATRKLDAAERAIALEVEAQKKKMETQLKDLERQLAETATVDAIAAANFTVASTPSASLGEELARISAEKAAQLRDLENEAKKKRETVKANGEAALSEITRQLQQPLSSGGLQSSPKSRAASLSGDRPMSVAVQGTSFSGSRTSSCALSVAYTQELNRIRMARAKERQERLAKLHAERDAAIAAVSVSPARSLGARGLVGTSTSSDTDSLAASTIEELKATHADEIEAKKKLYARLEDELKNELAQEISMAAAATTAEQQSAVIAKAVDAEMELYVQEVQARHARMQLENAAKREKLLADHQLALEAYERKKKEMETRQAREEQEAKEAFIQEKVDAAVETETAKLEAEHATAMARLTARYEEERGAVKGEVDEEIDAYERAERQKIVAAAMQSVQPSAQQRALPHSASDDSDNVSVAVAAVEARCAQLLQQLTVKEAQWVAEKAKLDARREDLEARRTTLLVQQQQHEQHLKTLRDENVRLAASLAAAETQRDSVRRAVSAATPASPSPAATPSEVPPPSGYRLRATHEAALRIMEDGYRAEQSALETDLQSWRSRGQRLMQEQQRRPSQNDPLSTGLNTPRQQVFPNCSSAGVPTAAGSAQRTPMLSQPSPIVTTAAGTSLQNTPVVPFTFGDSPWIQPRPKSITPTTAAATTFGQLPLSGTDVPLYGGGIPLFRGPAPSVDSSAVASTTRDTLFYNRTQQSVQQRQASLLAAREAWQQQRAREHQQIQMQQLQRHLSLLLPPSARSSFCVPGGYEGSKVELNRASRTHSPQGQSSPHQQAQLSLALSKLSSRLDSLTGQAEQLQRRRSQSEHVDPRSVGGEKDVDDVAFGSRSHLTRPQRHKSAHQLRAPQRQEQRKSIPSPHSSRQSSRRHDDDTLLSKWNHLLSTYSHN